MTLLIFYFFFYHQPFNESLTVVGQTSHKNEVASLLRGRLQQKEEEEGEGELLYCLWERRQKRSSKVGLMRINGTRRR